MNCYITHTAASSPSRLILMLFWRFLISQTFLSATSANYTPNAFSSNLTPSPPPPPFFILKDPATGKWLQAISRGCFTQKHVGGNSINCSSSFTIAPTQKLLYKKVYINSCKLKKHQRARSGFRSLPPSPFQVIPLLLLLVRDWEFNEINANSTSSL